MLKLSAESLDWALEHALSKGDTDILPRAFEFQAIKYDWEEMREYLVSQDVLKWIARPLRRCLSPKRRYGFRVATQLDPLDFLILSALIYEIGAEIEAHRLEDEYVVSHRFCPDDDGSLFDPDIGYSTFQDRSKELAKGSSYVVTTDIADFFPRLYLHRVEGALSNATTKENHSLSITRLLSQWNQTQSYGIPVGPAPARLIAEIAVDDVDRILRSEDITFVRYIDDYRLFVKSTVQGYQHLAVLANALFKNHGLTLQQEKTHMIDTEKFLKSSFRTGESQELHSLSNRFSEFLESAGINDPYGDIEYADLAPSDQAQIDSLNLEDLLQRQLSDPEIDQQMVRFLLRRLGQLDNQQSVDIILENIERVFTVFPDVIQYFGRLRRLDNGKRKDIGKRVLSLVDDSSVSQLDFHRTWLFSLFSEGTEWGNSEKLVSLYSDSQDNFSKRKLTLALAKSGQDYWFRTRKDDIFEFGGWLRRAFLAGASCLPNDERKHWYRFLKGRLDVLEKSVYALGAGQSVLDQCPTFSHVNQHRVLLRL